MCTPNEQIKDLYKNNVKYRRDQFFATHLQTVLNKQHGQGILRDCPVAMIGNCVSCPYNAHLGYIYQNSAYRLLILSKMTKWLSDYGHLIQLIDHDDFSGLYTHFQKKICLCTPNEHGLGAFPSRKTGQYPSNGARECAKQMFLISFDSWATFDYLLAELISILGC